MIRYYDDFGDNQIVAQAKETADVISGTIDPSTDVAVEHIAESDD